MSPGTTLRKGLPEKTSENSKSEKKHLETSEQESPRTVLQNDSSEEESLKSVQNEQK